MRVYYGFLIFCLVYYLVGGQQCKDDKGQPVDWFFGYKPPVLQIKTNMLLRKGLGFIYIKSTNATSNWKLSLKSVNDSSSFLGQTLAPLYNKSRTDLLYLLYNDEPPSFPASLTYGHSKGVVMTDGKVGMWMVHSSPKFPMEPESVKKMNTSQGIVNKTVKNKYFFPRTASKYGQSFLCITLAPSQMNKVGTALKYIRPKIYSHNIPDDLKQKFSVLAEVIKKEFITNPPWYHKINLTSLGSRHFVSYVKSKEFGQDLYADWLAPDLKSDLQVETWSNGPNELPSNCKGKYHVMDVKDIEIKTSDNYLIRFKNSQDHSKWAVTDSNTSMICVGDINRMHAQFKRGGGTLCYKNSLVWNKYVKSIADVQPCQRNLTFFKQLQTNDP